MVKFDGEEGVGVPVSEVLADATTLGVAWHGGGEIVEALPAPAPTPRDVPRLVRPEEALSRLSLRGSTVYLGNVPVLAPQAKALRALLAVFVHLAQEDARHGRQERKGHTTQRLLGEAALMELHLDEGDVRKQVKRMNDDARKATVRAGGKPVELVELVERVGSGYRLGAGVVADQPVSPMASGQVHILQWPKQAVGNLTHEVCILARWKMEAPPQCRLQICIDDYCVADICYIYVDFLLQPFSEGISGTGLASKRTVTETVQATEKSQKEVMCGIPTRNEDGGNNESSSPPGTEVKPQTKDAKGPGTRPRAA